MPTNKDLDRSMYYLYSDEAGISAREPITVVATIIIHADQWRLAKEMVERALDQHVPPSLRSGFIFHAKSIWGDRKYHDIWNKDDRIALIGAMASIPNQLGSAISVAIVRRDWDFPPIKGKMPLHDFHHLLAFRECIARANKYVRDWGEPGEVVTVVAEDVPDKRPLLRTVISNRGSGVSHPLTPDFIRLTKDEQEQGVILQTHAGEIDRIIDTVHFVDKGQAPLLQIADAGAFTFRRYFSKQDYGDVWLEAMLGESLVWDDWQGPMSFSTFSFNPQHCYPISDKVGGRCPD